MAETAALVNIYAFHQDQITELPAAASVFSSSEFCPYAGLSYGDSIISVQAHPEFDEDCELALLNMYSGNIVPQPIAAEAIDNMKIPGRKADTQLLANWLADFFLNHKK